MGETFDQFLDRALSTNTLPAQKQLYQDPMKTDYKKSSTGEFETGLFDCFNDLGTCLISWFCPCVTYGQNQQRAQKKDGCVGDAAIFALAACCGCYSCVGASGRGNVRAVRNIEGGFATDCLVHCCCVPCALTQEKNELDKAMTQ